jgi:hypothetical protein
MQFNIFRMTVVGGIISSQRFWWSTLSIWDVMQAAATQITTKLRIEHTCKHSDKRQAKLSCKLPTKQSRKRQCKLPVKNANSIIHTI